MGSGHCIAGDGKTADTGRNLPGIHGYAVKGRADTKYGEGASLLRKQRNPKKKQERYEGILIKESVTDDSIIDCLNIHKIELWNTGGKPKYWTALFFTSDRKDFPEQVSKVMLSDSGAGENWFVDFKTECHKYIVFKERILKYQIGNQAEKEYVCSECRKLGIVDEQMNWSE